MIERTPAELALRDLSQVYAPGVAEGCMGSNAIGERNEGASK